MNKAVTPEQLELTADKSVATPHIAPHIPAVLVDEEDFDWTTDDAVILREQRATAVYHNKSGELIVRQQRGWDEERDAFVYVSPENVTAFLEGAAKAARE